MRRATFGNLLNYSTTVAAQALFARRFGAGSSAAAYVIAFGLMAALSGVFVTTVQSVVLPRLFNSQGALYSAALRLMLRIGGVAALISLAVFILAAPLSMLLSSHAQLNASQTETLLRIAAISVITQVAAGQVGAWCFAKGHRFIPAFAPAIPSTAVAAALILDGSIDVAGVLIAFTVGSIVQVMILAARAGLSTQLVRTPLPGLNRYAVGMLLSTALLGFISPFERVVAATHSVGDAARYDYAARSLAAVLSIIMEGSFSPGWAVGPNYRPEGCTKGYVSQLQTPSWSGRWCSPWLSH